MEFIIGGLIVIGMWAGALQVQVHNKADKSAVALAVSSAVTAVLQSIDTKLEALDLRQRQISEDVIILKTRAEEGEK